MIMMFSGATIPSGWALCDGNNNTPDLRNKFIVAANAAGDATTTQAGPTFNATTGAVNESGQYEPGDTGGETAHQLTIAELAAHNHSLSNQIQGGGSSVSGGSGSVEQLLPPPVMLVVTTITRTDHHIMLLPSL